MKQRKLAVLAAFLLTVITGFAQTNLGIVKGSITTSDNRPAEMVTVKLKGGKNVTTITDAQGKFVFQHIPAGGYTITATLVGYKPVNQAVTVNNNGVKEVSLTLEVSSQQLQDVIVKTSRNKYTTDSSSYAAKVPMSYMENPQVYTDVTQALIKDQQVTDFRSALLNVPGGVPMQNPDRSIFIMLRGFEAYGNIRNGVPLGASVFNNVDPVNLDRIEILKGPSATLFGSSITSYGGLVNRITKKPYDSFGGDISYTAGQYDASRVTADINTPVNADKTALLRVNAAKDDEGSFLDAGDEHKWIVAPSFTYKVTDRFTLSLDAEVAYNNSTALIEGGQGLDNLTATNYSQVNLPYTSSLTGSNLRNRVGNSAFFAEGKYKISNNWTSSTTYSYGLQSMDEYNMVFTNFQNDSTLSRAVYALRNARYRATDIQENITGYFNTGSVKHRLLLGVDYYSTIVSSDYAYVSYDQNVNFTKAGTDNMNIDNLDQIIAGAGLNSSVYKNNALGVYASDVVNFTDNLIGMASVRVDRYVSPGAGGYKQTDVSPKFGLVYQLIKNKLSLFGNYQNGFQNQNGFNFANVSFKPQQANQWEGGVKVNIINNRLTATLTYYDILVKNILITDTAHPAYQTQGGSQRSKGFEAELSASPVAGLNIMAGYGYNDNSYVNIDADLQGKRPVESPANTVNFWANYKVQQGALKNIVFGFGGNYVSQMFGYFDADNHTALPAYTVLFATINYDQPKYSIGLRENNLTGAKYWNTNLQAQMPSQLTGTLTLKF